MTALEQLIESLPVGAFCADTKGHYQHVNRRWCEFSGLSPEQARGEGWQNAVHPDDRERVVSEWNRVTTETHVLSLEFRFKRADGKISWLRCEVTASRDSQSSVTGYLGTMVDISTRKALSDCQEYRTRAFEAMLAGASESEVLSYLVQAAEAANPEILGAIMKVSAGVLRTGSAPSLPASYLEAMDGLEIGPQVGTCGSAAYYRTRQITTDIQLDPRWEGFRPLAESVGLRACWSEPILSPQRELLGTFAAYHTDARRPHNADVLMVTELAQLAGLVMTNFSSQRALREALDTSQTILDTVVDPIVTFDEELKIRSFNRAAQRTYGYEQDEVLGQHIFLLIPEQDRDEHLFHLQRYIESGQAYDTELSTHRKSGETFRILVSINHFFVGGSRRFTAVIRDQTERKLAASELELERHRLREVIDLVPHMISARNKNGVFLLANEAMAAAYGLTVQDLLGRQLAEVHPNSSESQTMLATDRRILREGRLSQHQEEDFTRSDGHRLSVQTARVPFYFDGQPTVLSVAVDITALKVADEAKRQAERKAEAAAEEERHRISRELHDSVSQGLYGIGLGLNAALEHYETNPARTRKALDYALDLARSSLNDMRGMLLKLQPAAISQEGLCCVLEQRAQAIRDRYSIRVETDLIPEPDCSDASRNALFHIAMEAMHNSLKHANPNLIRVVLDQRGPELILTVTDDGPGLQAKNEGSAHIGLSNMAARAEKLGGSLQTCTLAGGGAQVRASVQAGPPVSRKNTV